MTIIPGANSPNSSKIKAGTAAQHFIAAVALLCVASLWAIGLVTSADAALHPTMTVTPAEARRKPREIAPPYIVEWVVPDWYRSKLSLAGRAFGAH
jgi:hypothetical protein